MTMFKHLFKLSAVMNQRSKEGLTKARVIDAVLNDYDTRGKLRAFLKDITRKDLNYHLQKKTHGGLGFKGVLTERNGKIIINKKNLETISRTMEYLIKLPKYKAAFDAAFAECYYSGYAEIFSSSLIPGNHNVEDNDLNSWAFNLVTLAFNTGIRVPWDFADDERQLLVNKAFELFQTSRGPLNTKIQISYISTVFLNSIALMADKEKATLSDVTTYLTSTDKILENAKKYIKFTKLAFGRIVAMANGTRKTFLDTVNDLEKALMVLEFISMNVFKWKIKDLGSELLQSHYKILMETNPWLANLSEEDGKKIITYYLSKHSGT